jgi:hypothetical protein
MLCDLVSKKNNKHEFWWFLQKKTLCLDKTAITFAYEVRLTSFLYEKVSTQKVTSEFNDPWSFWQILESQNSKGKIDFFALLYFQIFIFIFRSKLNFWISYIHTYSTHVDIYTHIHTHIYTYTHIYIHI